jgi:hypothetical protein
MKGSKVAVLGFLFLIFLSVNAHAANVACFDWSCNSTTGVCSFNSGCSQIASPGYLWRYSWDFGDGNTALTGSSTTSNTYATGSGCYYPKVKLTVIPFNTDPFSVECEIVVWECVGPAQGTSGRCTT